jgi:hypothetical protein
MTKRNLDLAGPFKLQLLALFVSIHGKALLRIGICAHAARLVECLFVATLGLHRTYTVSLFRERLEGLAETLERQRNDHIVSDEVDERQLSGAGNGTEFLEDVVLDLEGCKA